MKKTIVWCILLMLCSFSMTAGPAYPGRIVYTQPDGTTIGIYLHGDEFYHWMTDDAGNIVVSDENGFIKTADATDLSILRMKKDEASVQRAKNTEILRAAASSSDNFGSPEIPVLLIGFSDAKITKTRAQFDAMLNTPGYSDNGAIGSVFDYYNENSFGQFTPHFDVLEPVNLSSSVSTYGSNENNAYKALVEACDKLNDSVDFSKYDNNKDGYVDFIIFYFGGYDEAQCPQTSTYTQYIWSHASNISSLRKQYDNVYLGKYFCTSELKGYGSNATMCSIGTTCHEFAHTLGLPDFYDVAYQNGETSTQSANMYDFDLMAGGSYNGNSTTPPYLNAEELLEIGWLTTIPELTTTGSVTLPALNYPGATKYSAYLAKTSVSNEYFVFETRGGTRWDAYLPTGMMVYHVDRSTNKVSGSITAASVWNSNRVNSYAAHPCCYIVPAVDPTRTSRYTGSAGNCFFPGSRSVRTYSPEDWSGKTIGFQLTDIAYSNQVVTFNLVNSNVLGISGTVMDSDGHPLEGAAVSITAENSVSSAPVKAKLNGNPLLTRLKMLFKPSAKRLQAIQKAAVAAVVTDSEGHYSAEVDAGTYQVTVSKEGYVSQSATVSVTSRIETKNFYLLREGEELPSVLYAWPTDILTEEDEYIVGSSSNSITGQNLYPASELGRYAGKQIKSITFFLYGDESTTYEGVNAIIDYDSERKATVAVSPDDLVIGGYTTVDLRDLELVIPSNKDIYAGVGYKNGGYSYNNYFYSFGAFFKTDEDEDGNEFVADWAVGWPYDGLVSYFNLTATGERSSWDVIFDFTLTVGDYEAPDTGYNYIADPKNGSYSAGDVFDLALVETTGDRKPGTDIAWYLDDEPVSGTSLTLSAGSHVIEARFTTTEGKRKVVELEITVQ